MARRRSLVVVSNRLPATRQGTGRSARWTASAGGLVTALLPLLQARGGDWVGWIGGTGPAPRRVEFDGVRLSPVGLSAPEVSSYYHGFCNRTLWPLFHDAIRTPEFNAKWWGPYVEVNRRFARAAAKVAGQRALVWIHDYHLLLAPQMLRELRPDLRIGFFLHIPFPPDELFSWLPWRRELLEGMLGADVVGFQTRGSAQNFSRLCRRLTDAEAIEGGLEIGRRHVVVREFPISIDSDWFESVAGLPQTVRESDRIRRRVGGRKILLSVDRLDYTKGIDARLKAFQMLLRSGRVGVDECLLLQIASPSRELVKEYAEMRTRVDRMVGSLNGDFSEPGRVAVHYFRRTLTREELVAYYRAADVMVVTPLRDGMNLVAKEYVASRVDVAGVLVLSEFAGAAQQMRQAILTNPRDIEGMAEAMHTAIRMRRQDARFRMAILRSGVRRHDVHEWANDFLGVLAS